MNLKDRMRSDSNSSEQNRQVRQQESEKRQEDESLRNTNESTKKQAETISKLSSEISMLKNKVLAQKQEIVDLNEWIVKLSESDKQLKEAYSLKSAAEEAVATSSKLVAEYKETHEERMAILDKREKAINKKEARVNEIEADQEAEISKRVKKEVSKIESKLKRDYDDRKQFLERCDKEMVRAHLTGYITSIVGLYFAVAGTIATSKPYQKEAATFFIGLWKVILATVTGPYKAGVFIAGKMINKTSNPVGYKTMGIIDSVIFYVVIVVMLIFLIQLISERIVGRIWDGITVAVIEFVICVPVFFAPLLTDMPINSLLLGFILFIVYILIRIFIAWDNEAFKKEMIQDTLIIAGSAIIVIAFAILVSSC